MKATEVLPGIVSVVIDCPLPKRRPQWYYNTDRHGSLSEYHQVLLEGIKWAASKPTNLSKVTDVIQDPDESLSAFLEHLLNTCQLYTPMDPEDLANLKLINLYFVTQSASDMCRKIQKMDGFVAKNRSELLETAQKV